MSGFRDTGVPEDEGQFLQTVYPVGRVHGGPGRFAFDPAAHLTETSALVTPENARQLREEWGRHWDLTKPVLLEKSPPNLVRTRFLQAMFPGAAFVIVLRHPVAVALAVKTRRPKNTDVEEMLRHWVAAHEVLEADLPHLDQVHVVTYETFVRSPDAELAKVQSFLGLSPMALQLEVRRDTNERYFSMWQHELRRWLRGRRHRALVHELDERVRRFGYSLEDLTASLEAPALR